MLQFIESSSGFGLCLKHVQTCCTNVGFGLSPNKMSYIDMSMFSVVIYPWINGLGCVKNCATWCGVNLRSVEKCSWVFDLGWFGGCGTLNELNLMNDSHSIMECIMAVVDAEGPLFWLLVSGQPAHRSRFFCNSLIVLGCRVHCFVPLVSHGARAYECSRSEWIDVCISLDAMAI